MKRVLYIIFKKEEFCHNFSKKIKFYSVKRNLMELEKKLLEGRRAQLIEEN